MQRTSIFILATLLAVPATDALAKPGHGKARGHAKQAQKAHKANSSRTHVERHQGQDRNGDGIISRGEWRGNARSFDVQDRNDDGVISWRDQNPERGRYGANARYGAWSGLDRDRDGVLTRGEWPHGYDLFNQIDRNRDGLVSQWELRNSVR
jgi:hypothetical protein